MYYIAGGNSYGGYGFNRYNYKGSKVASNFAVTFEYAGEYADTAVDMYTETTAGFTYTNYMATINVAYPVKVGNKKTYVASYKQYNYDTDGYTLVNRTYTSTVKAVKTPYKVGNKTVSNAVVVEVVNDQKEKGVFVFQLNKGLVFAEYESYETYEDKTYTLYERMQLESVLGVLL